jgi:hypothetical protein
MLPGSIDTKAWIVVPLLSCGLIESVPWTMVDAWGLKKGMKISATKVVESTETEMATQRRIMGTMPPPLPHLLRNTDSDSKS